MDTAHRRMAPLPPPASPQGPVDHRALVQDIVHAAQSGDGLLLFTHYERTLAATTASRRLDALPLLVRGALVALATTPCTRVVVISGHAACDLEAQVNVPGVIYAGCRGLEIRGPGMSCSHPAAEPVRARLPVLARELSSRLGALSGVEVEVNGLGLTIHVRRGDPPGVAAAIAHAEALRRATALPLRLGHSDSAVELVADVDWARGATATWVMEQCVRECPGRPAVVYVGGDGADEDAYRALRGAGHGIHVGPPAAASAASYWVADRAAAVDLLARLAFAWSARPRP